MSAQLTVIGLGSGDENQLTLGIWKKLREAQRLYLRTAHHPVVAFLTENGVAFESFDAVYETHPDFIAVYDEIVKRLLAAAEEADGGEILYAVPGHPWVAERTTVLLRDACAERGIPFAALGGESFLDQAFLRFGFDPVEGFQLLDAAELAADRLDPRQHLLIGQVYDAFTASDAKLALMEIYPDEYPVTVGHALGVAGEERIRTVPLYELDREEGYGNLSLIYVPRSAEENLLNRSFGRLHEIVGILRSPGGCPWDREQTHDSLRKNLIEEAYEVLETIDEDDPDHMQEELGDLMLQVMLHAQIEEETGAFTVYDVIRTLNEKLIRRHPHVFGDVAAEDADEALANWQEVKRQEREGKEKKPASALDGIPRELPGLMKAWKLQKKAASVGFDWSDIRDVFAKVEEELAEVRETIVAEEPEETLGELGDLLFSVVNLARFLKTDPEEALAATNRKFYDRFRYVEEQIRLKGGKLDETGLDEMERYWQEAKTAVQEK
ncbi:bifunctional methyltransferase/pyrophosphohydrolase YabN [Gorillibacterium timonense]|uniref:nucleoside triphosphate pyrophosphohydrolase n=1 Tax=Gorillibacterium timonense TaxID=1689269 RepID=UPI00071D5BC5|nr:nucleoside triphosphate pyrophosphohydrolase [Gorillibacterium timonense]